MKYTQLYFTLKSKRIQCHSCPEARTDNSILKILLNTKVFEGRNCLLLYTGSNIVCFNAIVTEQIL